MVQSLGRLKCGLLKSAFAKCHFVTWHTCKGRRCALPVRSDSAVHEDSVSLNAHSAPSLASVPVHHQLVPVGQVSEVESRCV